MDKSKIKTLGELKASGYKSLSIKDEIRNNLIEKLRSKTKTFDGILGFENTVIPDIQRALLSRHNILFLGLRGQAKTRIARLTTDLLNEYIPVLEGAELNDDPLNPISRNAFDLIEELGDKAPIGWIHRSERYVEKLATPDVSVADLIGDVDPIKAASLKLPYSDERVIHFGLVPRAHRSIFVINELPDLQPRIQVSLFNILQEGDIQIRGFKLRLPLDILFVFTANPEDYTNRGSIITPLKDRIESQILTHYPIDLAIAKEITKQEANIKEEQGKVVRVSEPIRDLLEQVVFAARSSELIDDKSGVSARLSITAMENLYSTVERRTILHGESKSDARITDFWGIIPAITGKVELVYEGEQEGPYNVAIGLIQDGIEQMFDENFEDPNSKDAQENDDPYEVLKLWFSDGNTIMLNNEDSNKTYQDNLMKVPGLRGIVLHAIPDSEDVYFWMELVLQGLAAKGVIQLQIDNNKLTFNDILSQNLDEFNLDFEDL